MTNDRVVLIKPGNFGQIVAADGRRGEFDIGNEVILSHRLPVDAVFIGDSITHMWELNAYFGRNGRLLVNRGIGGDISSHVARRFAADVIQLQPKCAVIKIGVNNFWALDGWTAADRKPVEEIVADLVSDVQDMVRQAKEHGIVPVICSVLPTHMPHSGNDGLRNTGIQNANELLRTLAAEQGAIYVDYHSRMVQPDRLQLRGGLADDGLHPHVRGYDIMAETLRETLRTTGIDWLA
ncbi:GDSL-type esterase/lipase family protein [Paenibacillus sp. MMS20-IR301]|uniref:GDSL-type esterase/lipase family protein n=1 Tax=Paenibacillus sp. MMS20-IR301 TaxID=2895946 RepID=UPI0028EA17B7|nr:GDSL-type esterase/lipase family protein [Paenibacillus sp. MMS20-IR301]WNS45158.1 GDSL-type esterase/lipase family protein [Paenibacillus sp. MMS20-IR301]